MKQRNYRGLTKDGKWVHGWYSESWAASLGYRSIGSHIRWLDKDSYFQEVEVIPESVGQSTGLLDKKGKEIYASDIVTFDNSEIGGKKYIGEIVWNDDQTLGNLEWGLWTKKGYLRTDFLGLIEVIGNVHESKS